MNCSALQLLALMVGLAVPTIGSACSVLSPPLFKIDKAISVAADGSFENAGEVDNYGAYYGKPIVDVGNGRVGQRIIQAWGCSSGQTLLFVDCTTKEMIQVSGTHTDDMVPAGHIASSITEIQYPKGPIRLTKMSVSEVAAVAKKHDYTFSVDVMGELGKMRKKNRYDPFMGCKIFYPESIGAKS